MSEKDEIKNEEAEPEEINPDEDIPEEAVGGFREVEKEEDDQALAPAQQSNKKLIALLSLVIILALFIFFKGEDETPVQEEVSIQTPQVVKPPPAPEMPEEKDNASEPNPGEIRIAGETSGGDTKAESEKAIVPIPKEEFDIFEPLGSSENERPPAESEELVLLKKAGPQPKPELTPKINSTKPSKMQTAKPPRPDRGFTIQLGAFKQKSVADKLDEQLRQKGYDSFVLAVNKDLFRVRVGSFKSREEAKVVSNQIKKTEQMDSFITTE